MDFEHALFVPEVDVRDAENRVRLLHWLQNLVGPGTAEYALPSLDILSRDFAFSRVRSLASFWDEEGEASLTRRMGDLLGGLGRVGRTVVFAVHRDGSRLSWQIGIDDPARSLAPLISSAFPGAVVEDAPTGRALEGMPDGAAKLALAGVPVRLQAPFAMPLVERFARTDVDGWALIGLARPVPPDRLLERYRAVSALRRTTAVSVRATRTVSEVETREEHDPVAELACALLSSEEQRMLLGARTAAFVADVWLLGGNQELVTMGATAAAALAPESSTPRPLRVVPEGPGVSPATLLLPEELAAIFQPPVHDLRGFEVHRWARFDVHVERPKPGGGVLSLGDVEAGDEFLYAADDLPSHALVTGATGSGKSSLVRSLLGQLGTQEPAVPYLVVEPTKEEYAELDIPGLEVWRVGATDSGGWKLNPLEVPAGIPLQTHIDLLIALFESTFALFPPLPYLLEVGLRRVYTERGWHLASGRNALAEAQPDHPAFPTLRDLLSTCLRLVGEFGYAGEVRDNVRGALHARLGSLLEGPKGVLLDTDLPLDVDRLLSRPCVVNLDLVGSDREKAFFMGLMLIRLWEARRGSRSRRLRHVTVLEEAHRILPATPPQGHEPTEAPADFAAETFTNLLAEVRAAGEGIVVVEQSPSRLAESAVVNTSLKVAFRTMGARDRELLARSMNLDEAQERVLTSLSPHDAVVFAAGMDAPVRVRANAVHVPEKPPRRPPPAAPAMPVVRDHVVSRLADLLLRVDEQEAEQVRLALLGRTRAVLPPALHDRVDLVARDEVAAAVERLGRARALPHPVRQRMIEGALREPAAGTLLEQEGDCACEHGSLSRCRLRELVDVAMASWRREGRDRDELLRFPADADALASLRARIEEAYGTDVAPRAVAAGVRCLALQALRAGRSPREAVAVRDRLVEEGRL